MKISQKIEIDKLVSLLLAKETLPEVTARTSQIRALSKAITFVENDPLLAPQLLSHPLINNSLLSKGTQSRVIGITGLPGAGKSSLTNLLIKELRKQNKSVAVLAVDPSSVQTGGAILGDRIRMHEHFKDQSVFIRSMGSRGALGGLSQSTRGAIRLASLLNFDYILVETVGIGQSESEIVHIADTTLLVLMPNSGDEIQLMKAGILQLANIYVVNKCDLSDPSRMIQEISENTMPMEKEAWTPPVLRTSVSQNIGIEDLIKNIFEHQFYEENHPKGQEIKQKRLKKEVLENILIMAENKLKEDCLKIGEDKIKQLNTGQLTAMYLATEIFNKYFK